MIDELARVIGRPVSRETVALLDHYLDCLRGESKRQNLVAESTLGDAWRRHILDSAQLAALEPRPGSSWADIGSGAGLPGIVIAALVTGPVTLIEPRRLRAEFLGQTIAALGLSTRVAVVATKAERAGGRFDVIAARAVANVDKLLEISTHLSTKNTQWVLPKGRSAESELAAARRRWHCEAQRVPSCTDPESEILVLRNVKAKGGR
ncbi:MAG TPA: 16S rRNA (guanine(527)-N(7))-methyltransferase RsmG [Sphingomicrobium sp.]|nr:16S rRNA (guanine(527)-N(7))-methyltransferase RsmG [Sphingomicrobium sp.]